MKTDQDNLEKAIKDAPILIDYLDACGAHKLKFIVEKLLEASLENKSLPENKTIK